MKKKNRLKYGPYRKRKKSEMIQSGPTELRKKMCLFGYG